MSKGDRYRPVDHRKYSEGYDRIFKKESPETDYVTHVGFSDNWWAENYLFGVVKLNRDSTIEVHEWLTDTIDS